MHQIFAENLRALRGKASRASFAKELGINENTLRNYEKGHSLPNFEVGLRICRQFGVDPGWLLDGEDLACTLMGIQNQNIHLSKMESHDPVSSSLLTSMLIQSRNMSEMLVKYTSVLEQNADLKAKIAQLEAELTIEKSRARDAPEGQDSKGLQDAV